MLRDSLLHFFFFLSFERKRKYENTSHVSSYKRTKEKPYGHIGELERFPIEKKKWLTVDSFHPSEIVSHTHAYSMNTPSYIAAFEGDK